MWHHRLDLKHKPGRISPRAKIFQRKFGFGNLQLLPNTYLPEGLGHHCCLKIPIGQTAALSFCCRKEPRRGCQPSRYQLQVLIYLILTPSVQPHTIISRYPPWWYIGVRKEAERRLFIRSQTRATSSRFKMPQYRVGWSSPFPPFTILWPFTDPFLVELAKSARAGCTDTLCKKEGKKIAKGELRFGSWVELDAEHGSWKWKHW
jgi:hypothetical protein